MSKPIVLLVCAVGLQISGPVVTIAEEITSLPHLSAGEKRIQEALNKTASLEFIETPLTEVFDAVKQDCGIEIRLDVRALEDLGVSTDEPVTINVRGISLRSALRLMFRPFELTYIIRDEVLLITSIDEAENELTTRVYPVRDLVESETWQRGATDADQQQVANFDSLVNLIVSTVNCASWDEYGGSGNIQKIVPDQLVIAQTQEVHEEITGLLTALRKVPPFSEQESERVFQPVPSRVHKEAEEKIGKALDSPTDLDFIDTPLSEIAFVIKEDHGIEVRLDVRAFEDLGINIDEAISMNLRGITLGSALRLMLRDLELTFVIKNEALVITTLDEANNELSTVVYPVGDIVDREYADDGKTLHLGLGSLIKTVLSTVVIESWDVAGGPGSIVACAQRGVLVVSQTQAGHHEVSNLLGGIRAARKATGYQPTAKKLDPAEVVVRTFWYHADALGAKNEIVPHVEHVLDVNEKVGQYVVYLPNRIVVRQRCDAQAKLRRLLVDELKICTDQPPQGKGKQVGGFGGGGLFSPVQVDPQ